VAGAWGGGSVRQFPTAIMLAVASPSCKRYAST